MENHQRKHINVAMPSKGKHIFKKQLKKKKKKSADSCRLMTCLIFNYYNLQQLIIYHSVNKLVGKTRS